MNIREIYSESLRSTSPRRYGGRYTRRRHESGCRNTEKTGTASWAVKAQIHAGGRGKGGGVKIARSPEEVKKHAKGILGMQLVTHQTGPEGKIVHKVLVEQGIYYKGQGELKEFYMSVLLNRKTGRNMILYSTEGVWILKPWLKKPRI